MWVKKQQLEPDMKQTSLKLGTAYLAYMQNTSCEMPKWMNHKLESNLQGEVSIISDRQMILP